MTEKKGKAAVNVNRVLWTIEESFYFCSSTFVTFRDSLNDMARIVLNATNIQNYTYFDWVTNICVLLMIDYCGSKWIRGTVCFR